MPWKAIKGGGCSGSKPYAVVKVGGERVACHETLEKAQAQVRALYANEPSASHSNNQEATDLASNLSQTSEVILMSETTLANGNGSPVTITVTTNEPSPETTASWEGILAVEGSPSSDRRYLIPTEISARELPLPLRVVTSDEGGHDNAVQAGRIEDIQHIPIADFARREEFNLTNVSDNAIVIWAQGVFDGPDDAVSLAQTMMRNGAGVSLDLPHDRLALIDPETFEEIAEEDIELADALSGKYLTGIAGKIAAATIVDIPAFEEATIRLSDGQAIVASAFGLNLREGLVASAGKAPLAPPRAWFEMPEPNGPTPLTITEDGQVYGHLATWNQCHASFPGSCELAPRSKSGYQYFHLGAIETAEGGTVPVGRVTVGKANEKVGGHNWDLWSGAKGAIEHYDRTGAVAAFVRAKDGKHGIWLCGATRSDAPPEAIRDMRANPPSGDWRYENGGLELVAALSVPVPGFPVPYLVASSGDQVTTLIMPPYEGTEEEVLAEVGPRSAIRRMAILSARGREALAVDTKTCPDCGDSMPMDAKTCPECGYDMGEDEEEDMASRKKKSPMPPIPVPTEVPETTPAYADEAPVEETEDVVAV